MTTVYFDLETDGLDDECQIIQIGAVAVDDGGNLGEDFQVKMRFYPRAGKGDEQAEALEMNSYDADAWERFAVEPEEGLDRFAKFLKRHATVPKQAKSGFRYKVARIAGHNAVRFDFPILQRCFKAADIFLPVDFTHVLDTLELAKWLDVPTLDLKLGTLAEYFAGAPIVGAHDALFDARIAALLGVRLSRQTSPVGRRPA